MTAVGYNEHSFHWRHSRWEFLSRGGWRRAKREEGGKTWAMRILHVGSTSVRVRGLKWNGPPVGERETGRGNHTPDHPRTSAQKTWWSTWGRWYAEGRETIAREGLFLDVKKGTKDGRFFFFKLCFACTGWVVIPKAWMIYYSQEWQRRGQPGSLWLTRGTREDKHCSIIHYSTGATSGSTAWIAEAGEDRKPHKWHGRVLKTSQLFVVWSKMCLCCSAQLGSLSRLSAAWMQQGICK